MQSHVCARGHSSSTMLSTLTVHSNWDNRDFPEERRQVSFIGNGRVALDH